MTYSNKAIIEAVTIIRDTCREMDAMCDKCPFYDEANNGCVVNDMLPSEWHIRSAEDIWRAID